MIKTILSVFTAVALFSSPLLYANTAANTNSQQVPVKFKTADGKVVNAMVNKQDVKHLQQGKSVKLIVDLGGIHGVHPGP